MDKIEKFLKSIILGFLLNIIILHGYVHLTLVKFGFPWTLMKATFIFEILLFVGIVALFVAVEKYQPHSMFSWIAYFLFASFGIFEWIQYNGYFREIYTVFPVFPLPVIILYLWAILVLLSVGLLLLIAGKSIFNVLKNKKLTIFSPDLEKTSNEKKKFLILFFIGILFLSLAFPIAKWANQEDKVVQIIEIDDTNFTANLAIWDAPLFSAQIGNTQEIDLDLLDDEDLRAITALGKMNTTFYWSPSFETEVQLNKTIALLKMLDAFNCTLMWTIWYPNDGNHPHFVRASHAASWINNAREVLELVIEYNFTNVLGIAADSEQSTPIPYDEYFENIDLYDAFLKEVQTNASLRHPCPTRETFETVLVFEPLALRDSFDGDTDSVIAQRKLGLPPHSWTQHHFMTYRQSNGHVTGEFYNYLIVMEHAFGLKDSSPIVGVTGVQWFAEGYFNGTSERFFDQDTGTYAYDMQENIYDGIDGWEAMKREILISKAFGFQTLCVFHLNAYTTEEPRVENFGFIDYYGLESVEELAEEWNEPKTISYPIITPRFGLGQRNLFRPNPEIRYDLLVNIEMIIVNIIILISIPLYILISNKNMRKDGEPINNLDQ